MASEKKTAENEDITFSRAALTDPDPRVAEQELEKRNKAMPEGMREHPEKVFGWPPPEDRLPAVMPADKEGDHDYKQETYDKVNDEDRDRELRDGPGSVARTEVRRIMREAGADLDMNELQAPPTNAAQDAAEGKGMLPEPVPVVAPAVAAAAAAAAAATPAPAKTDKK